MPFVVDASVTICWLMPDERHPIAMAALARMASEAVVVPSIWWFETRNILLVNERRGRVGREHTMRALDILSQQPVTIDTQLDESRIMRLAREHGLTVYDAAYLELAQRNGYALATLDSALAKGAKAASVVLIDGIDSAT